MSSLFLTYLSDETDFIPSTYYLPSDFGMYLEDTKRNPACQWIMKPPGGSQGKGVFLVTKPSQIKRWDPKRATENTPNYIISRYIDNPLLIGYKKFDLRLYCLVISFKPLKVIYKFKIGLYV